MKKALITGITGQDGAYLSEFLIQKGYLVHGIKRRSSSFNTGRVDHLFSDRHEQRDQRLILHYGDVTDTSNVIRLIKETQPDEIYNLAAQSHVAVSFETPEYTAQADAIGTLRLLEAIRILGLNKKTKFYQASTSELFGDTQTIPQDESTPFHPCSPYAVAKLYAYWITVNYRQAYGIFASNGILFNHESPIRGETFVTRKITRAVARIAAGKQRALYLGNLDARRDWGHARDYVEAMWRMMQHSHADDFVIATGQTYCVREFVSCAFKHVGITLDWRGAREKEVGFDIDTQQPLVFVDARYFRPTEVNCLQGNAAKAERLLGWKPTISFDALVQEMVAADVRSVASEGVAKEDRVCVRKKRSQQYGYML